MKKMIILLLILLLFSISAKSQDLGSGLAEEEVERQKITINFWHFWKDPVRKQKVYSIIAEFEQMYPNIKVELVELSWSTGYEEIKSALENNYPLDIVELGADMITEFCEKGYLKDITPDVQDVKEQYIESALIPVTNNNKIYGLPWVVDTRVMFYNKDLLKLAGYNPEQPPQTWDELLETVKKIHNIKPRVYGFGMNARERHVLHKKVFPFIWSNNGEILSKNNDKCIINSKQNIETLKFYMSLKPYSIVASQNEIDTAFCEGRVGFWISGSWLIPRIKKDYPKLNFGIMMIPKPVGGKSVSILGGEYLVVNAKTEHYAEVINLIKFITSKEKTVDFCSELRMFFPPVKEIDYKEIPWIQKSFAEIFAKQIENSYFVPQITSWIEIKDIIEDELANIIEEKRTVEQALNDAQIKINKILVKKQ